jgi:hypothetical protein
VTRTSRKANGAPAFQFYVDDWISETELRLCDLGARGLWIEMLCIMWKSEKRGFLTLNGKPMSSKQLAKLVGEDEANVKLSLDTLLQNCVCGRDENGVIYSRRMAREEDVRLKRVEAGRKGGRASRREAKE